ncbi:protein kinase C, brain isozyme-like isoform X2 [Pomacea canaliculata]|uniref:protein kinase C, brain isozyme-like isoform X2 n=1 Tax=Pomacea canaliculata TaxID=400727 RepID=UPI000D73773D|nr:protein kinase C, brain isozyme-like isoform X2 [Pomacea canaliculata]
MIALCSDDLPCHRPHRVRIITAFVPHLTYTRTQLLSPIAFRCVGGSTHPVGRRRERSVFSGRTSSQTRLEKEKRRQAVGFNSISKLPYPFFPVLDKKVCEKYGMNITGSKRYVIDEKEVFSFRYIMGEDAYSKIWYSRLRGKSQKVVAIKMYDRSKCSDELANTEILVLKVAIGSPFIVQLHSSFQTPTHWAIVMKLARRRTLHEKLRAMRTYSEIVSRFYAAEIAEALFFLHSRGIVLRYLNLDNLVLTEEGHAQLCDFSLSYLGDIDEQIVNKPMVTDLKLQFPAPELIVGNSFDKAVDWWSYGVILYRMICGQYPFLEHEGKTWTELEENVYRMEVYPSRISPKARRFLTKLLTKKSHVRLGRGEREEGEIRNAAFFRTVDWHLIRQQVIPAPFTSITNTATRFILR